MLEEIQIDENTAVELKAAKPHAEVYLGIIEPDFRQDILPFVCM